MHEGGRIINIGSGAGTRVGWPGMTDYTATKAALAGYTRGAARDLGPRGITVNIVQAPSSPPLPPQPPPSAATPGRRRSPPASPS
jgi:NAD(P)-dependent dehydrogenase (short-subunit alcohol dehydrogenase family)